MSKPPYPCNEPPKEDFPKAPSNQPSPQCHSPPLINPYIEVTLQATQDDNQTLPPPPQSPNTNRGLHAQEIDHSHDLSNLLEMHLQNHMTNALPPTPLTPPMPHTICHTS
ncbi:hypothetical protein Tco_0704152 [Tanacetum coccineum]|uniref:Uncharacterized protein n=1 Tax=Tanacetum coccineum TaxID=301880 RepID=A0ABQ4Y2D9_9ASTR